MKDLLPLLRSLGLLESEIKTYMAAFEQGAGTVLHFTKLTKLSRQATYVAIDGLSKRGLMSSVLRGKKRFYAAEHPGRLLAFARRRENELKESIHDLERAIPELELQMGGEKPIVKVFEGKEGIRAVIEELRASRPDCLYEMTDVPSMLNVITDEDTAELKKEVAKIKGQKIGIFYYGPNHSPSPGTDVKRISLPKKYSDFRSNIGIYGNKLAMITFEGKMHSVIIENKALIRTLQILFELAHRGGQNLPE
ncbi:hypothetical protein FJZ48_00800 [Candidatus Uhrbacteria bacterium]|nr:hypothetical protein [Candidatus Uhrbacteria bacterium]